MKSARRENLLGLVLLGALVLLSIVVSLLPGDGRHAGEGSISSVDPLGRRALYLLLQESGFDVRAFGEAPRDLPRGQALLWLPRAPTADMPTPNGGSGRAGGPDRVGLHRLDFYRTFVESGGTIVLSAGNDTRRFLVDTLAIVEAEELEIDEDFDGKVEHVRTGNGEDVEMDVALAGALKGLDPNGPGRALWIVEDAEASRPFAVEFPSGLGAVVVLAGDAFLANAHIGEHQHALAAVRLVEELKPAGPILFSEYEAGRWDPPSTLSLLFGPNLFLASLHGLALLGLFVWMHGFARAFPRDPEPLALFSPYLRARSLADTLVRGRRLRSLAAMLQSGSLARLRAVARVRPRRAAADESGGSVLPRVGEQEVVEFAREAGIVDMESDLRSALAPRTPANTAELDALDLQLKQLREVIERRARGTHAAHERSGKS